MKGCLFIIFLVMMANTTGLYEQYYPLAEEIVQSMSLDQKIGQTTQIDYIYLNQDGVTQYDRIRTFLLGSVLVGGNGCPDKNGNISTSDLCFDATSEKWNEVAQKSLEQYISITTPEGEAKIRPLLGTDAVHGNQHAVGELLFPHGVGMAATHNPQNFANAAYWNKVGVMKSGFNFAFAPTVAVSHNPQWGRFHETLGTNPENIKQYAKAYIQALQDTDTKFIRGVLGSTKHFFGDGATFNGNDEGNVKVNNYDVFYQNNIQGYIGALEVNTGTIMASYSAINEDPMHVLNLLNVELKQNLHFDGFIISDYNAVLKAATQGLPTTTKYINVEEAYQRSFDSGVDMQMISDNAEWYQSIVRNLINNGQLSQERLDDAVKRILAVKLAMSLIDVPKALAEKHNYEVYQKKNNQQFINQVHADQKEYNDALQCALESFVLLKNKQNVLPLNKKLVKHVILIGDRIVDIRGKGERVFSDFDNIGAQNGGWTIRWQGYNGNDYWQGANKASSRATSILDAIKTRFATENIYYANYQKPWDLVQIAEDRELLRDTLIKDFSAFTAENTVIIYAQAENPYTEFGGDINCEYCFKENPDTDQKGCIYNAKVNEYLPDEQIRTLELNFDHFSTRIIDLMHAKDPNIPVVSVLFSGRPMIVNDMIAKSNAFIAAWLPGTTGGEAVVQALFGEYLFRSSGNANTLAVPWVQTMESLKDFPVYNDEFPTIQNPLFVEGYGLETKFTITE